jgi:hypothetical protein
MNAPNSTESALPEKPAPPVGPDRIPPAVRKVMESTAPKLWPKLRAYVIGSEEEGELIEMLPEMHRVMTMVPPKLLGLIRKRKLTAEAYTHGFAQLHDSLHGVRQAMYALLHLAGYKVDSPPEVEAPEEKPGEAPPELPAASPPALERPGALAPSAQPGSLAIRSGKN